MKIPLIPPIPRRRPPRQTPPLQFPSLILKTLRNLIPKLKVNDTHLLPLSIPNHIPQPSVHRFDAEVVNGSQGLQGFGRDGIPFGGGQVPEDAEERRAGEVIHYGVGCVAAWEGTRCGLGLGLAFEVDEVWGVGG